MNVTSNSPLVSVICCVYNAGEYLRPSVDSILAQTYTNLEILIIDDGSTDGCVDSLQGMKDPRIRIIRQSNRGRPAASNLALREVRGDFYVINDADDLSAPTRVERLLACMMSHPEIAGVMSGHEILMDGKRMAPRFRMLGIPECRRSIEVFAMPAHDPTAMYRISMVRGMEYDESLRITHGVDYTLRVGERFPMMVVGECLYIYRVNWTSLTKRDPTLREREVERVLRKACQRRGVDYDQTFCASATRRRGKHQRADNNLAADFMESVLDQRRAGAWWGAIHTGWSCSCLHPLEAHYHKAMVYALAPMWLVRNLRRTHE